MSAQMDSPPEWAYEFHGHRCPFMPMGYRMGIVAMRELGIDRERDHGTYAFVEHGVGHPQTCLADGVMIATGCTYGKLLMERLGFGKHAIVLYSPSRGARRVALEPQFQDELGKQDFFALRRQGVAASKVPREVADRAIEVVLNAPEPSIFKVESLPDFRFARPPEGFAKQRCSRCGEYVFERYLRSVGGEPLCVPCSGFLESHLDVSRGLQ